ncbi:hypothetical protein QVD99_007394 [Batrachochytrium dendrobatidis]|nr:hypothetical protein O5D80_008444 [Batrachochytrium dendrobatidis]KAK5665756.1 hypothetical protein QVD99_007394 [Batrachochytrium dendrobatidis]
MSFCSTSNSKKFTSPQKTTSKDDRLRQLESRKKLWMTEMTIEKSSASVQKNTSLYCSAIAASPEKNESRIQATRTSTPTIASKKTLVAENSSDLLVKNWCLLPSISQPILQNMPSVERTDSQPIETGHPRENQSVIEEWACPICHQKMSMPVLAIPCGHSFCKNCINTYIDDSQKHQRPIACNCCGMKIQAHVPNLALRQILNATDTLTDQTLKQRTNSCKSDILSASSAKSNPQVFRPNSSCSANQEVLSKFCPDFDQDPAQMVSIYEAQYQQLQQRCVLLEEEFALLEKNRTAKQASLESTREKIVSCTAESIEVENLIDKYTKRSKELQSTLTSCNENVLKLDVEVKHLMEREALAMTTLDAIAKRRDKVKVVFEGIQRSLQDAA